MVCSPVLLKVRSSEGVIEGNSVVCAAHEGPVHLRPDPKAVFAVLLPSSWKTTLLVDRDGSNFVKAVMFQEGVECVGLSYPLPLFIVVTL